MHRSGNLRKKNCVQALGDSHVVVPPPRYDVQGLGFDALFNGCT
jgi:hypothetical protein